MTHRKKGNKYRGKRDANHKAVADHLRAYGVEVNEVLDPLDLLCEYKGFVGFCEVKVNGKSTYTRTQLDFIANTKIPVAIVKDGGEAMRFLKTKQGLAQKQKDALAGFLAITEGNKWHNAAIERVLET